MRSRNKPQYLGLGVISEGTLKTADLIPAFVDALTPLHLTKAERTIVKEITTHLHYGRDEDPQSDEGECAQYDYDALSDMVSARCPDHTYFGPGQGDGACFGVWPSDEIHSAPTDEVGKGDELPPCTASQPDHFLVVNDHGNSTLYRKRRQGKNHRWVECWSVV